MICEAEWGGWRWLAEGTDRGTALRRLSTRLFTKAELKELRTLLREKQAADRDRQKTTEYGKPPRGDSRLFHRRERGRFVRNVVPTFLTASFTEIFEASAAFLKASYVRFRRSPWSSCGSPHPHVMHISDSPLNEV